MSFKIKLSPIRKQCFCIVGIIDGASVSVVGGARYIMRDMDINTVYGMSVFLTKTEAEKWIEAHHNDPLETPQSIRRFFGHTDFQPKYEAVKSVLAEKRISDIYNANRKTKSIRGR